MGGKKPGFRVTAWDQTKKVRLTREGGFKAPVKANGKDGIVVGDPPLSVPPGPDRKTSGLGRLLARVRAH